MSKAREDQVEKAAKALGLTVEALSTKEWKVRKRGKFLGTIVSLDDGSGPEVTPWGTSPTELHGHTTVEGGLNRLIKESAAEATPAKKASKKR